MTVTEQYQSLPPFEPVTFDLYRDIHKGIRAELFAVTTAAGSLDPADRAGRADLARHVDSVVELLVSHAEHEDAAVQPAIEAAPARPRRAASRSTTRCSSAHRGDRASWPTTRSTRRAVAQRDDVHRIYIELASFTSAYLAHQDLEERVVMPALERAIGVDAVLGDPRPIVGALTPEETAMSLPLMLPAMNVDDRAELLGGMQQGAPPEVFAQVWGLVRSALTPRDGDALAKRLGLA